MCVSSCKVIERVDREATLPLKYPAKAPQQTNTKDEG